MSGRPHRLYCKLQAPLKRKVLVDCFQEFCNSGTIAGLYVLSGRKRTYALVDFESEDDLCKVLQESKLMQESIIVIDGGFMKVRRAIFIPTQKGKTSQARHLRRTVVAHPQHGKLRCPPSTVLEGAPSLVSPNVSLLPDEQEMLKEIEAVHNFLEANSMRPSLDKFLNEWL